MDSFILFLIYYSKKKINGTEEEASTRRFYGHPPTSCEDLNKIGYTLNGYYLIKGNNEKQKLDNANRIQVVYCQFLRPPGANKKSK